MPRRDEKRRKKGVGGRKSVMARTRRVDGRTRGDDAAADGLTHRRGHLHGGVARAGGDGKAVREGKAGESDGLVEHGCRGYSARDKGRIEVCL